MRIGLDIDGVLADFVKPYQQLHVLLTGRDSFLTGDNVDPPYWDWPEHRGYSEAETELVRQHIRASNDFWRWLQPIVPNTKTLRQVYGDINAEHEVYFITSRSGIRVKQQTERWLANWVLGIEHLQPTVLIAMNRTKGLLARGLGLDCYLDDSYDNALDVVRDSPTTRTYLLDRNYNRKGVLADPAKHTNIWYTSETVETRRVFSVAGFLHAEGLCPTLGESKSQ